MNELSDAPGDRPAAPVEAVEPAADRREDDGARIVPEAEDLADAAQQQEPTVLWQRDEDPGASVPRDDDAVDPPQTVEPTGTTAIDRPDEDNGDAVPREDRIAEARANVDQVYEREDRIAEARADLDQAYRDDPPSPATPQDFDRLVEEKIGGWTTPADQDQSQADNAVAPDLSAGMSPEQRAEVLADAKAELADREQQGDQLGGDPVARVELWHEQGENERGYRNDCALASTAAVLADCGVTVTENDIVEQAAAENRCRTTLPDAADNGGVRDTKDLQHLIAERGVDSDVTHLASTDDLARLVEDGHGVIAPVNAGELWEGRYPTIPSYYGYDEQGRSTANHAVVVTGTVRDADGELTGFVINDTGPTTGAGDVVSLAQWDEAWTYGSREREVVVTTDSTAQERSTRS